MNIQKFGGHTKVGVQQVLAHIGRKRPPTAKYGNELIDRERTADNYSLIKSVDPTKLWNRQLEEAVTIHEAGTGRKVRSDAVTLCGLVVQLPHEYCSKCHDSDGREYWQPLDAKEARRFFVAAGNAAVKHFGIPTHMITAAEVHMDETTPHLHLAWVPLRGVKLDAKTQVCRSKLQTFHDSVDKALKEALPWYKGGIVAADPNERLKAKDNVHMDELRKVEAAREHKAAEVEQLEVAKVQKSNEVAQLQQLGDGMAEKLPPKKRERIRKGKSVRLTAAEAKRVAVDVDEGQHGRDLDAKFVKSMAAASHNADVMREAEQRDKARRRELQQIARDLDKRKMYLDELEKSVNARSSWAAAVDKALEGRAPKVNAFEVEQALVKYVTDNSRPIPSTPPTSPRTIGYSHQRKNTSKDMGR